MAATEFPDVIVAGDSVTFNKEYTGYEPDDGYTLTYVLNSATASYSFTASNDDNTYLVFVDAITSQDWVAGVYQWQAHVEAGVSPTERYTVESGTVTITANFAAGAVDNRSHVKKTLDLIEAELESRATGSVESYAIKDRSMSKTPMSELLELRSKYNSYYQQELQAERVSRGLGTKRKILTRFT